MDVSWRSHRSAAFITDTNAARLDRAAMDRTVDIAGSIRRRSIFVTERRASSRRVAHHEAAGLIERNGPGSRARTGTSVARPSHLNAPIQALVPSPSDDIEFLIATAFLSRSAAVLIIAIAYNLPPC
jgi:hypothetical protein